MQKIAKWLNPWGALAMCARQLDAQLREIAMLQRELDRMNDRADRLRDANAALREALTLYRNDPPAQRHPTAADDVAAQYRLTPRNRIDEQTLARYRLAVTDE